MTRVVSHPKHPKKVSLQKKYKKETRIIKKAARISKFNSFSGQRWRLDGNMLENKAGDWKSDLSWFIKAKHGYLVYIENNLTKVLEATSDGKVIEETQSHKVKGDQLWIKGKPDAQGYFTLENSVVSMVLTAISEKVLEIKGNITIR